VSILNVNYWEYACISLGDSETNSISYKKHLSV
jgi:hypothetical protein